MGRPVNGSRENGVALDEERQAGRQAHIHQTIVGSGDSFSRGLCCIRACNQVHIVLALINVVAVSRAVLDGRAKGLLVRMRGGQRRAVCVVRVRMSVTGACAAHAQHTKSNTALIHHLWMPCTPSSVSWMPMSCVVAASSLASTSRGSNTLLPVGVEPVNECCTRNRICDSLDVLPTDCRGWRAGWGGRPAASDVGL